MEVLDRPKNEELSYAALAGAEAVEAACSVEELAALGGGLRLPEDVLYTIRVPPVPGKVPCPHCGLSFRAGGPTGYAAREPICDLCLLEGSNELGMLLALASVTRAFGSLALGSRKESREALVELGAFARIYERFAARSGPARGFRLPGDPRRSS